MQQEEQGTSIAASDTVDEGTSFTLQQRFYWDRPGGNDEWYTRIPFPFLLLGAVDAELIRSSLELLIRRHDALRTRVLLVRGAPRQRFVAPAEYHLEVVDVSEVDKVESEIDERVRCELRTRFARRIVLDVDPLFDATLFRLAGERHVLVFWIHHILFDAYTPTLIFQQFWALYAGLLGARPYNEKRPMQYSQYCAWQQANYSLWVKEHRSYWKNRLSGGAGIQWPDVPNDLIHTRGVTEVAWCAIGRESNSNLREQARRSRTHLSTYLLAAYAAVIRTWCNQRDFVLTATVSGRVKKEHVPIVGYLVQPLYLRVQTESDGTFDSILKAVSKEYIGALLHMDFGETVLENPDLCSGTLFQWSPADWRFTPPASLELGFRVEKFEFYHVSFAHEKFKLEVRFFDGADELSIAAAFRPDYFPRTMVDRLLAEICRQLERVAEGQA